MKTKIFISLTAIMFAMLTATLNFSDISGNVFTINRVFAEPYGDYTNYDYVRDSPNYMRVRQHNGMEWFLDLTSVNVHEYNPPYYKIEGVFVYFNNYTKLGQYHDTAYYLIEYDYDNRVAYVYNTHNGGTNSTVYSDGESEASKDVKSYPNALFLAAYGMNFFK